MDEVLVQAGAMHKGSFGDAVASVCDAERTTEVLTEMLKENPDLFSDNEPLKR
ncbi:hypothetical protein D3C74_448890 [compost metagenome]